MDLGAKPVKDFRHATETFRNEIASSSHQPLTYDPQTDPPPSTQALPEEGREPPDDRVKIALPEYILPAEHRPQHYKPDIIRAIGYILENGTLTRDPTYHGPRSLQIIECKYSTDYNMHEIIEHITELYTPLKDQIQRHGTWPDPIQIVPIVISRTGSFHTRTLSEIAQLISPKEQPPDINTVTYRTLDPTTKKAIQSLHIHAQQWLSLILSISKSALAPRAGQRHNSRNTI